MKNIFLISVFLIALHSSAQIKLIVRADDMGSCRAANLGVIESFKKGIATATEVMVPCSWFNDAAEILAQNRDLDVGLHMVLNSEWVNYRWRPLTPGKSLIDQDGFFHQMVWPGGIYTNLSSVKLDLAEVEAEFRAQLSYALKKIPQISHISEHMYFGNLKPELSAIIEKIAAEYHLGVEKDLNGFGVQNFSFPTGTDFAGRKAAFIAALQALTPGTYHLLAHPCVESIELSQFSIDGKASITGTERIIDYQLFTDPDVMQVIIDKEIELIGYKDLMMSTPTIPSLILPIDSAVLHNTVYNFEWSVSTPGIEKYQIDLSSSRNFETAITDSSIVSSKTTFNRTQIPKTRTFYWRVRAKNAMGWSAYSDTFQIVNTYVTAINQININDELKVHFNSDYNTLNASLPKSTNENYLVSIIDLSGKTLLSKSVKDENGNIQIETGHLKSGIYILSAVNSKDKFNQKFRVN